MADSSTLPPTLEASVFGRWMHAPTEAASFRAALIEEIRSGGLHRRADLRGVRLTGADLSGADLSGCDLSGAELSRADLSGADLRGANLSGAALDYAILDRAELSQSILIGASLEHASAKLAGFGRADLRRCQLFGAKLSGASFVEARLRRADLRTVEAQEARFCGADLSHCDFARADLAGADLSRANVDHASFLESDLRRTRLRSLQHFGRASMLRADIRDVDFTGAYLLRRHIVDENFLDEFKNRSSTHRVIYGIWWVTSDCGRSLLRWSAWTAAIALAFGLAFAAVPLDYGAHQTWLSPFYFSLVTLTTLGYGDIIPADATAQTLAMAEVSLGYMMLGGLISIFSNKLARRGD